MKRFWGLCLLAGTATLLSFSQTLAQSGVVSGPPQIRPESKPQAPPPLPQVGGWIAVAAGFDGSGQKVSVGYSGHQSTRAEAENEALRFCNNVDRAVSCRDPFAVSNGCLYIVPGSKRNGGVTWGRGATPAAAFAECRRGGYTCPDNKLFGGCVSVSR